MFVLLLLFGLLTGMACSAGATATAPPEPAGAPTVRVGSASFSVELALSPEERQQGLSGRQSLPRNAGMLFVFEEERTLHFWMKDMRFPLDILWIDARCRLAGVAAGVPAPPPGAGNDEIPRAQSPSPARFVLEVNAGEAARNGLWPGDAVEFRGTIEGRYGC